VVLAHLRRRWSLSGREGFGFLSPSYRACEAGFGAFGEVKCLFSTAPKVRKETEANDGHCGDRTLHRTRSRFDRTRSTLFGEVKCLFSTAPEVGKETEANGCHCGDRTLHRTRSRFDWTRPVSSQQLSDARVLGFPTGASSPSWNRSIWSGTQRGRISRRADRTRGASGHVRSDVYDRGGSLLDSDRSPGAARPVTATVTSNMHCSHLSCSDPDRCVWSARFEL
jgi:hypothetical protein